MFVLSSKTHNNINVEDKLIRNLLNKSTFNARKYKSFYDFIYKQVQKHWVAIRLKLGLLLLLLLGLQFIIYLFVYLLYKRNLCTKRYEQLVMLFYYYFRKIKCTVLIRGPFKAQHSIFRHQKFIGEKNSMCPFCRPILAELIMHCKNNLTTCFLFLMSKQ